jgi:hypothetical protein
MDTNRNALISVCFLIGSGAFVANAQPPKIALIEPGRVLDVRSGAYLNQQGILVENERIKEVGDLPTLSSGRRVAGERRHGRQRGAGLPSAAQRRGRRKTVLIHQRPPSRVTASI